MRAPVCSTDHLINFAIFIHFPSSTAANAHLMIRHDSSSFHACLTWHDLAVPCYSSRSWSGVVMTLLSLLGCPEKLSSSGIEYSRYIISGASIHSYTKCLKARVNALLQHSMKWLICHTMWYICRLKIALIIFTYRMSCNDILHCCYTTLTGRKTGQLWWTDSNSMLLECTVCVGAPERQEGGALQMAMEVHEAWTVRI